MNIEIKPGKYVVAVSGGVDSVVLLDVLSKLADLDLVVAHFDHGIREDSVEDRKLVAKLAKHYKLPFEYAEGKLGLKASEATAREARYRFLHQVREKYDAAAIITAHHQDDLLETVVINWLRGTGRRGLSSLGSGNIIKRPLLHLSKSDLLAYAKRHNLDWHEDSTNEDETYLRNYARQQIMPRLSPEKRTELLNIIEQAASSNQVIDEELSHALPARSAKQQLDRRWFTGLPHAVAREVMAAWLRQNKIEIDKNLIERLVAASKTYRPGKYVDVNNGYRIKVGNQHLALEAHER